MSGWFQTTYDKLKLNSEAMSDAAWVVIIGSLTIASMVLVAGIASYGLPASSTNENVLIAIVGLIGLNGMLFVTRRVMRRLKQYLDGSNPYFLGALILAIQQADAKAAKREVPKRDKVKAIISLIGLVTTCTLIVIQVATGTFTGLESMHFITRFAVELVIVSGMAFSVFGLEVYYNRHLHKP